MRDDRAKWTAPGDLGARVVVGGQVLERQVLARQTLVSGVGVRDAARGALVGWPEAAIGECYTVCLRRDQVLVVNEPEMRDGWNAEVGQAVSDVTDGFAVFDLSGPRALDVLQRGAEIFEGVSSASAMRKLFGMDVIVYRTSDPDGFRLHIERALSDALQEALTTAMGFVDRQQKGG